MAKELTGRQREVFDFVCEAIRQEGRPPTVREIAERFGFASPKAASDHLTALERKGYLSRPHRKARNIEVAERLDPRGIPVIHKIDPDTPVLTLANVDKSLNVTTLFEVDQKTIAVQVRDDNMREAGIKPGDYVVVEARTNIEEGAIGAVQLEGELLVRRVSYEVNSIRLVAENGSGQEMLVDRSSDDFQLVGPVKGIVRSL